MANTQLHTTSVWQKQGYRILVQQYIFIEQPQGMKQ
jgi:hypothetical protein